MIKGILIINNHGKVRLSRFYAKISQQKQQQIVRDVFAIVSKRSDAVCNFVEPSKSWQEKYRKLISIGSILSFFSFFFFFRGQKLYKKLNRSDDKIDPKKDSQVQKVKEERELSEFFDSKLIYRHYATLFFVFLVDQSESELGILDLIQVFVEALDERFKNVCELDIVFRFDEVNNVLDEIVMGGMVLETNLNEITTSIAIMKNYEKTSKTVAKNNKTVIKSHITG
ncbi:hypothetical protein RFI_16524 [Reticulomyxa filosa]|uniref:AP complex subunit sigma n=1 Tax=Reticulomyxa filosa TaxID=46433 RepID=X6N454_RETFI|nr:hypothetical protein RFI_16524 [Reticulomyxa filosa]|eukprot:ETO20693.1 hypothetical protein RFI_16524 [Reticulomyxa filosa]